MIQMHYKLSIEIVSVEVSDNLSLLYLRTWQRSGLGTDIWMQGHILMKSNMRQLG